MLGIPSIYSNLYVVKCRVYRVWHLESKRERHEFALGCKYDMLKKGVRAYTRRSIKIKGKIKRQNHIKETKNYQEIPEQWQ